MSFWTLFAAVISANLLTVGFVWAVINISRREKTGEPFTAYLPMMLMPLLFCGGALLIAFEKTALLDGVLR